MKRAEYFPKKTAEREAAWSQVRLPARTGTARHHVIEFDSILRNLGRREYGADAIPATAPRLFSLRASKI